MIWITTALILGITGALHCSVMCGPLVGFYAANSPQNITLKMVKYHFGRISSYAVLGSFSAIFSESFRMAGLQKWMSITVGALIIVGLIISLQVKGRKKQKKSFISILYDKLRLKIIALAKKDKQNSSFYFGIANGFIPCGLVYTAMLASLLAGSYTQTLFFMILFGIANSPGLVFTGYLMQKLRFPVKIRSYIRLLSLILVSIILIYRGINVKATSTHNFESITLISTCD